MKRFTFLLGLLGAAVVRGQESTHVDKCWMRDGGKDVQVPCRWMNDSEPIPSGYCPLDGSKGEQAGYLYGETVDKIINCAIEPANPATFTAKSVLRCPHCGMLFTGTAKEAQ